MESITKVEPVKNKCPVCLEYYTAYLKDDGKLIDNFCSHICEKYYKDMLRPNKIKKILQR